MKQDTYLLVVIDCYTREVKFCHNLLTIFELQRHITKYKVEESKEAHDLYILKCYLETEDCYEEA